MYQTTAQISAKLHQFLSDVWMDTSLPDFGYHSCQSIYQQVLVPRKNDNLDAVRAKLHLLALAAAEIPDLNEATAQNIRQYAQQVAFEEHQSINIVITDDDLPF